MVLLVSCLASFLIVSDVAMVNVALPSIVDALGLTATAQQWFLDAYALSFSALPLVAGRLADVFGHRRVFLIGLTTFSTSAFACGIAPAAAVLEVARAVQGVGGAVLASTTLSLLTSTYLAPAQRRRALAVWSATVSGGAVVGILLGGVLTAELSWRWVFLLGAAVGAGTVVITVRQVPSAATGDRVRRLDLPGAIFISAGLALVVAGLIGARTPGWSGVLSGTLIAVGGLVLLLFLRQERRSADPLLPVALLLDRRRLAAVAVTALVGCTLYFLYYAVSIYLQRAQHHGPSLAAVLTLPAALSVVAGSLAAPVLSRRLSPRAQLLGSMVLLACGFAWLSRLSGTGPYWTTGRRSADRARPGSGHLLRAGDAADHRRRARRPGRGGSRRGQLRSADRSGGRPGRAVRPRHRRAGAAHIAGADSARHRPGLRDLCRARRARRPAGDGAAAPRNRCRPAGGALDTGSVGATVNRSMLRARSAEMSVALHCLTGAQVSGEGSVLLVTGEPGIGKTALLGAIREQAMRRGFAVGHSAAEEANRSVPGAAMLLALRSGVDPLADRATFDALATPAMQPLWLAEDVADLLDRRAQREPVLVALDDVQWADRLSRFLLRVLPGRLAGSPVVWVVASRPDPGAGELFGEVTDGPRVHRIALGGLPPTDLVELAADVLGGPPPDALHRWLGQVEGNPFLAVELARGMRHAREAGLPDTELPGSFAQRLRGQLREVAVALPVLQLAAVWGAALPVVDAESLLPASAQDLQYAVAAATAAGLLEPTTAGITFRHDLVREFVYAEVPAAQQMRLHRQVARHLVDSGRRAIEAVPHAAIGARTGDRRCLQILRQAAAESLSVPQTAVQVMKAAFDALPVTDPEWAEVGEQYANVLWHAQRGADALAVIDTLLTRTDAQDDRARLQVLAAHALWLMGRADDIAVRTQQQLSRPAGDAAIRVRLEATRALALSRIGDPETAAALAAAAVTQARTLDDRAAEVTGLHALAEVARNQGRHLAAYERFHELRTALGADYLPQEVLALQHIDRFDDAQRLLDQAAERAGAAPDARSPAVASAQVWQHFNRGRFDDASAAARSLVRLGDELGNYVHRQDARIAMSVCAMIHGELDTAKALVARAETERAADAGSASPGLLLVRARIADAEGDFPLGRELLRRMDSDRSAAHLYWSRSFAQFRLRVGIALAVGDQELAERTRQQSAEAAERNAGVPSYRGLALQVGGLVDGDLEQLAAAADILGRGPRPSMAATAVADLGSALLRAGHRMDGVHRLDQAWNQFQAIGFVGATLSVQRLLAAAGVHRRRSRNTAARPATGWESLTDTEVRVARLVADGHTNRATAQAMGISVNTVGTHLNSIFAKLAVRSRLQLSHVVVAADGGLRARRPVTGHADHSGASPR